MRTTPSACPFCQRTNDAAMAVETGTFPGDGDLSVCAYCAGVAVFTVGPFGQNVRKPKQTEQAAIDADNQINKIRRAILRSQRS